MEPDEEDGAEEEDKINLADLPRIQSNAVTRWGLVAEAGRSDYVAALAKAEAPWRSRKRRWPRAPTEGSGLQAAAGENP